MNIDPNNATVSRIDINDNKEIWKCCTGTMSDKRLLRFVAMLGITGPVLLFSIAMLSMRDLSCPEQNTFIGLITLILGTWLKSPIE